MFVLHLNSYTISIVNVGLSVVWRDWSTWVYNQQLTTASPIFL